VEYRSLLSDVGSGNCFVSRFSLDGHAFHFSSVKDKLLRQASSACRTVLIGYSTLHFNFLQLCDWLSI